MKAIGKATFFKKNDLLYRKFSSPNVENGRIFEQLIVPEQYRKLAMTWAHESILTGHLSVRSSVHKVLSEYYWPGIYKDVKRFCRSCETCNGTLRQRSIQESKTDRSLPVIMSATEGRNSDEEQNQVSETSQVSETTDGTTSMTSEDQAMAFSATFVVVGVCKTIQNDDYSCTTSQVSGALRKSSDVASVIPINEMYYTKSPGATVSTFQIKQNEGEALIEKRLLRDGRKTIYMYQGNGMLYWIFSFMTMIMMMMMMMTSCLGQWTCTLGKIFREGAERYSKRIRGWLAACWFIECYRISIVLFYETDVLPDWTFSETVMLFMWIYVVIRCFVEGVSIISEEPDWWLWPGKWKFTVHIKGSIANHGKAIWRYVLKRSAERSKNEFVRIFNLSRYTCHMYKQAFGIRCNVSSEIRV